MNRKVIGYKSMRINADEEYYINEMINDGYEPYGLPYETGGWLWQVFIKYDKDI